MVKNSGFRFQLRSRTLIASLLFAPLVYAADSAAMQIAQAAEQSAAFDIPAGPLAPALRRFAEISGLQVVHGTEVAEGVSTRGVNGIMSARDALTRLLAGTGLVSRLANANTFIIERGPDSDGARALDPIRVEGSEVRRTGRGDATAGGPGNQIARRNPTTEGTNSYTTGGVTVSGKTALSLRETPNTVSVITRERIDDQQLHTVSDALQQVGGVTVETRSSTRDEIRIRGFSVQTDAFQINGIPMSVSYGDAGLTNLGLALYDRVEVRKGASGLLQGPGQPGGTINLVRKRPKRDFGGYVDISAASHDNYRADGEITGPITGDGRLRGQVIAAYRDRQFFYDVDELRSSLVHGQLEFDLTSVSRVNLGIDWDTNDGGSYWGLPTYSDGEFIDVPRSYYLAAPWNENKLDSVAGYFEAEHLLSEIWVAKISGRYQTQDLYQLISRVEGVPNRAQGLATTVPLRVQYFEAAQDNFGIDGFVSGESNLFGRAHEVLLGANLRIVDAEVLDVNLGPNVSNARIPVFGYDPAREGPPRPNLVDPDGATVSKESDYGAYGSLRSHITSRLTTVLGGRVSWYSLEDRETPASPLSERHDNAVVTPYAGIVYDISANHSVYTSYADIFRSQAQLRTVDGSPLIPVVGLQYEAGLKGEYLGGQLNASLSLFRIVEKNRALIDPANIDYRIAAGEYESEGIEFEVAGQPLPGLNASASYVYNQLKIAINRNALGAPVNEGLTFLPNLPDHLFKAFVNYEVQEGPLQGLSLGGGATMQSDIASATSGTIIRQDGYALSNVRVGYEAGPYSVGLNVTNLLDKTYYVRVRSPTRDNRFGEPRTWTLLVKRRF